MNQLRFFLPGAVEALSAAQQRERGRAAAGKVRRFLLALDDGDKTFAAQLANEIKRRDYSDHGMEKAA